LHGLFRRASSSRRLRFAPARGHVIDAKNHVSAIGDVAVKEGKIAAVAERI
jgi:hypothetical protein